MLTLVKIILSTLLSANLFSCTFDININNGVCGNGHVVSENRTVNKTFTAIKATQGLDVYLTHSDRVSITVEADKTCKI